MNKKYHKISIILLVLLLITTTPAALVHSYDFKGATDAQRRQDKTGTADLSRAGSGAAVVLNGDGKAEFSVDAEYLIADVTDYSTFVISFWFRIDQSQANYDAIFSSYDSKDNGDGVASFQLDFMSSDVRITSGDSDAYNMGDKTVMSNPSLNTWHHIAVLVAPTSWSYSTQVWGDGGTVNKIASAKAGDLVKLLLGMNRNLNNGFGGSIANVKIYDGTDWNDTNEADEWAAGPGVSEVIPYNPNPANGATLSRLITEFTWLAGDPAIASYDVYFGLPGNVQWVGNYPTESVPVDDLIAALGTGLVPGGEYQWYVQSLDAGSNVLATGSTWTVYMSPVGDDFYVYNNTAELKQIWDDGVVNGTGSMISLPGVDLPTDQGSSWGFIRPLGIMQIDYDNTASPNVSEVNLTFDHAQNLLGTSQNTLSLSYYGLQTNDATDLYLKISDGSTLTTFNSPLPDDVTTDPWWKTWNLRFKDIQAAGINLAHVTQLTIGIGDGANSSVGTIYIDDVVLGDYTTLPEYQPVGDIDNSFAVGMSDLELLAADWLLEDYIVAAVEPLSGLRAAYAFDEISGIVASDGSGNGYDAAVNVSTNWDTGGMDGTGCLLIDETTEVTLPTGVMTGVSGQLTITMWTQGIAADFADALDAVALQSGDASQRQAMDYASWQMTSAGQYDGWHHYAVVKDTVAGTTEIYHDGVLVAVQSAQIETIVGAEVASLVLQTASEKSQVKVDNLTIYNTALTQEQIVYLIGGSTHQILQPITPLLTDADLYPDGRIDLNDLAVLSQNWLLEY